MKVRQVYYQSLGTWRSCKDLAFIFTFSLFGFESEVKSRGDAHSPLTVMVWICKLPQIGYLLSLHAFIQDGGCL